MRLLAAVGLAGACLASSPVLAADLFGSAPPPMDADPSQSELGSNWYIRGDVGYGIDTQPTVNPSAGLIQPNLPSYFYNATTGALNPTGYTYTNAPVGDASHNAPVARGNVSTVSDSTFDVALGYRVNDFLRVEGMYNFHFGPGYSTQATVTCPGQVTGVDNYYPTTTAGVTTYTAVPYGYVYPATQCNGYLTASQYNQVAIGSAYFDLGKFWIFQPYIGAGVGLASNTIYGSTNFAYASSGQAYTGVSPGGDTSAPAIWVVQTGTDAAGHPVYSYQRDSTGKGAPYNVVIGQQSWNRSFNSTKFTFAGQLSAGVGIPISQSATLDIGYRFLSTDVLHAASNNLQSVNVGVRYNIN